MILIQERIAKHVPGLTSLFIKSDYNQTLLDTVRKIEQANYDKKTQEWEISLLDLAFLLNSIAGINDIQVELLANDNKTYIEYKQPKDSEIQLFKHQEEAVEFGKNHKKWLLLDAPGLGKTLALIRLAEELHKEGKIEHCLVICGVNSLKSNWLLEIKKFSKLSATVLGSRINKKGKLVFDGIQKRLEHLKKEIEEFFVITNIETLRNKDITKFIMKGKNKFGMIILDECHVIKTPDSIQSTQLLKVKAPYQVGASGTLITNTILDCYMPLKWIEAEHSGFSTFKYYYYVFGGEFNHEFKGYKNTDLLKYQLEQVSLRRKKDLLNLPPKNIITEYLDMEPSQERFYNNIVQGIVDEVDKVALNPANVLALTTRLRQATSCPSILTTERIPSVKIDRCLDLTEQILTDPDEKVLIFTEYKETANTVCKALEKYKAVLCTGDIKPEVIDHNKDLFQNSDDVRVMVATRAKMGTGHTLNRAHYVIFIDQAWTAADCEQAQDRIHRIGTKSPIFVYNLITKDTFDERVISLLNDKKAIGDYIIDDEVTQAALNSLRKYIEDFKR